jgi:prolyl-tRNA editing enzyme YbaK/EbsC (Cys-tRNA(Pro) deacylase)
METSPVLESLRKLYLESNIEFKEVYHQPTRTSEESARARDEPLHVGGKALLLKCQQRGDVDDVNVIAKSIQASGGFLLVVLPADAQLDSSRVRTNLPIKKFRFATSEELLERTGLVPGSVPPFGSPIMPFPIVVERRLTQNDRIAFNAGSLTTSHILRMEDYLRITNAVLVDVCS